MYTSVCLSEIQVTDYYLMPNEQFFSYIMVKQVAFDEMMMISTLY